MEILEQFEGWWVASFRATSALRICGSRVTTNPESNLDAAVISNKLAPWFDSCDLWLGHSLAVDMEKNWKRHLWSPVGHNHHTSRCGSAKYDLLTEAYEAGWDLKRFLLYPSTQEIDQVCSVMNLHCWKMFHQNETLNLYVLFFKWLAGDGCCFGITGPACSFYCPSLSDPEMCPLTDHQSMIRTVGLIPDIRRLKQVDVWLSPSSPHYTLW